MTINLTVIGLGQIGGSIGLALAEHKQLLYRIGYDSHFRTASQAQKAGAFDRVVKNNINAVKQADVVILALPMDEVKETIERVAPFLKRGAVLMDTSPLKEVVATWSKEYLPEDCYYVGLTPIINPIYLHSIGFGFTAARPDLFKNGLIAIASPTTTASEAIKLATDITTLLGAEPFFVDLLEIDGLMARIHVLPQLVAASLINTTIDQAGWLEARKVAGRFFASASCSLLQSSEVHSLSAAVLHGKNNIIRVLNDLIDDLGCIRDIVIENNNIELERQLEKAQAGVAKWWKDRREANWSDSSYNYMEVPTSRDTLGRLIGYRKKDKTKNNFPRLNKKGRLNDV